MSILSALSNTEFFSNNIVIPFSFEISSKIGLSAFRTLFLDSATSLSIDINFSCLDIL